MRPRAWLVGVVGLALILGVGALIGRQSGERQDADRAAALRDRMMEIHRKASPKNLAKHLVTKVFPMLVDRCATDPMIPRLLCRLGRHLPAGSIHAFLVDRDERLLWAGGADRTAFRLATAELGNTWIKEFGLQTPRWRFATVQKREKYFAGWRATAGVGPGRVAGMVLVIDVTRVTPDVVVGYVLRQLHRRGVHIGCWDRLRNRGFRLPPGLSRSVLEAMQNRAFSVGQSVARSATGTFVVAPFQGTRTLVSRLEPSRWRLPDAILALCVVWLVLVWRWRILQAESVALPLFLGAVIGAAVGLPLLLTIAFWSRFSESRTQSIVADELRTMEQQLISIDRSIATLRREYDDRLRKLIGSLPANAGSLQARMAELTHYEIQSNPFDTMFIVSSAGVSLRDFSNLDQGLRWAARKPRQQRTTALQVIITNGGAFPRPDIEGVINNDENAAELSTQMRGTVHAGRGQATAKGLQAVGRIMTTRYNQQHTTASSENQAGDKTDLLYGAAIDPQTGDMLQMILSNLGRIIVAENAGNVSWLFFDFLRNTSGRAEYMVLTVNSLRNVACEHFDRLFANAHRWPRSTAFAVESEPTHLSFPVGPSQRPLRRLFDSVLPPRIIHSQVARIDGKKVLLTAFAGRDAREFVLFATRPWSVVEARMAVLQRQIGVMAAMIALLLGGIVWRLRSDIVLPADALVEGVRAMENGRLDHRVPLLTGDEWDDMARSFNATIEGMKELEVARAVQSMILPSAPIAVANARFTGSSIMTGQVGGDYYDAIAGDDGTLNFVLGDVSGHGVSAALVVAMAKSAFHNIYHQGLRSPAAILARLDRLILSHLSKKKALTMLAGQLTADGRLVLANAGHPFPYLLGPGQAPQRIVVKGLPLGVVQRARYTDVEVETGRQPCRLFMYTDGVLEQIDRTGTSFGGARLEAALGETQVAPATDDELLARIHEAVRAFSAGEPLQDDVTVAVLSIGIPGAAAPARV